MSEPFPKSAKEFAELDVKTLSEEELTVYASAASKLMNYYHTMAEEYRQQWKRLSAARNLRQVLPLPESHRAWRPGEPR